MQHLNVNQEFTEYLVMEVCCAGRLPSLALPPEDEEKKKTGKDPVVAGTHGKGGMIRGAQGPPFIPPFRIHVSPTQ